MLCEGLPIAKAVQPTPIPRLSIVPASVDLSGAEIELVEQGRREFKLADVLASLGHVAEGVKTAKSAYDLGQRLRIELPIINECYRVLYEDKPALEAVKDLMSRELTVEFDNVAAGLS